MAASRAIGLTEWGKLVRLRVQDKEGIQSITANERSNTM